MEIQGLPADLLFLIVVKERIITISPNYSGLLDDIPDTVSISEDE